MSARDLERCGLDLSKLTALKLQGYTVYKSPNDVLRLKYKDEDIARYTDFDDVNAWDLYIGIPPSFGFHLNNLRKILETTHGVI
jgi:hypothetical protein